MLLVENDPVFITIPSPDCILADKLTAFAPHTTGVLLGNDKDLEVMKQLFDIANLIDLFSDQEALEKTYEESVKKERGYRNLDLAKEDVLMDTINACTCIIGRGSINSYEYPLYLRGIRSLDSHVMEFRYTGEVAASQACKVMYLASSLRTSKPFLKIRSMEEYISKDIEHNQYRKLRYMKKQNLESFGYFVEAIRLLIT